MDGSFTFSEGAGLDWQSIEFRHADLARSVLPLQLELRPAEGAEAAFGIMQPNFLMQLGQDGALQVPPPDAELLDGHGFALRRLAPHAPAATAHEVVATTAYFSRRKVEGAALGKLAFIEEIWGASFPR